MRGLLMVALVAALAGGARADLASPPEVPGEQARGLLERWLKAQNSGDFAAYQVLYAATFTGVRRSGGRTVELDRAGWMRDRARMFKKKMRVIADQVTTAKQPGAMVIRFRQTWPSASYSDVGTKRLLVVIDSGEPRIARDEMVDSVKEDPDVEPLTDGQVETLRCLYKDIDARWRRVDDTATVESITTAPHQGATAVWVVTSIGNVLALCRGTKRIAGGNTVGLGAPGGEIMAITGRELRGDYLEVKPGLWAFAIVGSVGTYEDVPGWIDSNDGQEGLEDSASGTELDLFVRIGDEVQSI